MGNVQEMVKVGKAIKRIREPFFLVIPVLMMAVGSGWLGDGLWEVGRLSLAGEAVRTSNESIRLLIGTVLFIGGAAFAWRLRKEYLPVRVLSQAERVSPRKALILMVSRPGREYSYDSVRHLLRSETTGEEEAIPLPDTLSETTELNCRWNWLQILRAVQRHQGRLKRICLLGSAPDSRSEGSFATLGACRKLLEKYLGKGVVECHPEGVDFLDIDSLGQVLEEMITQLRREGYKDKEIMLDATGGMKTTSIAVALFTARHPRLEFQYVAEDGRVTALNVVTLKQGEIE